MWSCFFCICWFGFCTCFRWLRAVLESLMGFFPGTLSSWKHIPKSQVSSPYLSQKWCWCFWPFTSALPWGLLSFRTHLIPSPVGSVLELCFPSTICDEAACSGLDHLLLVLLELSTLLDFHFLQFPFLFSVSLFYNHCCFHWESPWPLVTFKGTRHVVLPTHVIYSPAPLLQFRHPWWCENLSFLLFLSIFNHGCSSTKEPGSMDRVLPICIWDGLSLSTNLGITR